MCSFVPRRPRPRSPLLRLSRSRSVLQGPERPAIRFSGLNFRNGHLSEGIAMVRFSDVDVVMEDAASCPLAMQGGVSRQNILGKFRRLSSRASPTLT